MFVLFEKYQGSGNDFILIDDRKEIFPVHAQALIQKLCDRRLGIGADGLLLLQTSQSADYKMRIFNADGKEAAMCGNGIRCLTHYVLHTKMASSPLRFETKSGIISSRMHENWIAVDFGIPQILQETTLHAEETDWSCCVVDTGVPHAVVFVPDVDSIDVSYIGREIRYAKSFQPEGVNVNFAHINPDGSLRVRTYERGVEGETLSCGTGLAATAFAAVRRRDCSFPMSLHTQSQEVVQALSTSHSDNAGGVELLGLAHKVYQGNIFIGENHEEHHDHRSTQGNQKS
jgi:diaminopimelate epimerase